MSVKVRRPRLKVFTFQDLAEIFNRRRIVTAEEYALVCKIIWASILNKIGPGTRCRCGRVFMDTAQLGWDEDYKYLRFTCIFCGWRTTWNVERIGAYYEDPEPES